jgi:aminoglycoside phosphotransferase
MNTAAQFLVENASRLRLAERGLTLPLSSVVLTPRFQASRHVVFLLFAAGSHRPTLVAKVPRLRDDDRGLEHEAAMLAALQKLRPGGLPSTPTAIAFEPFRGWPILVETAIDGPPMDPATVRREPDRCIGRVVDWLIDLHHASAAMDRASWYGEFVQQPLEYFARSFPLSPDETALLTRTRALTEPLRAGELPVICEHGDLGHPNLLLPSDGGIGVVDWELASMRGLVGYDLFFFLTFVAFSLERAQSSRKHVDAFSRAFFGRGARMHRFVTDYCRRADLPTHLLTPLFVLCWARYSITLLRRLSDSEGAQAGSEQAAWLRSNRYYALWRYAVEHAQQLSWRR